MSWAKLGLDRAVTLVEGPYAAEKGHHGSTAAKITLITQICR